jgi:hypothetical protein
MAAKRTFTFDDPPTSRSTQSGFLEGDQIQAGALPDFGAVSIQNSYRQLNKT